MPFISYIISIKYCRTTYKSMSLCNDLCIPTGFDVWEDSLLSFCANSCICVYYTHIIVINALMQGQDRNGHGNETKQMAIHI